MIEHTVRVVNQNASQPVAPQVQIDNSQMINAIGSLAIELVRGGMFNAVMASPMKQKNGMLFQPVVTLTPEEVVVRACDVSAALYAEFDRRKWMIDIPPHAEQMKQLEDGTGAHPAGFGIASKRWQVEG